MKIEEFRSDIFTMVEIGISDNRLEPSEVLNVLIEVSAIQATSFLKRPGDALDSFKQALLTAEIMKRNYVEKTKKKP